MVAAVFVAELMDQQPHHVIRNSMLEPVSAQPEFVEDQFSSWPIGSPAEMMRCGTELHHDLARQNLLRDSLCEIRDLTHPFRPFRFWNPVLKWNRVGIVLTRPDLRAGRDLTGRQDGVSALRIL